MKKIFTKNNLYSMLFLFLLTGCNIDETKNVVGDDLPINVSNSIEDTQIQKNDFDITVFDGKIIHSNVYLEYYTSSGFQTIKLNEYTNDYGKYYINSDIYPVDYISKNIKKIYSFGGCVDIKNDGICDYNDKIIKDYLSTNSDYPNNINAYTTLIEKYNLNSDDLKNKFNLSEFDINQIENSSPFAKTINVILSHLLFNIDESVDNVSFWFNNIPNTTSSSKTEVLFNLLNNIENVICKENKIKGCLPLENQENTYFLTNSLNWLYNNFEFIEEQNFNKVFEYTMEKEKQSLLLNIEIQEGYNKYNTDLNDIQNNFYIESEENQNIIVEGIENNENLGGDTENNVPLFPDIVDSNIEVEDEENNVPQIPGEENETENDSDSGIVEDNNDSEEELINSMPFPSL